MKEIIAFIRPSKMNATKKILDELGIPSVTALPVLGRGNQRGLNPILHGIEVSKDVLEDVLKGRNDTTATRVTGMKFVPKRMLVIVAKDKDVDTIVDALVKSNYTGYVGDGKIFVCPTDNALKVRTQESGDAAL